MRPAPVRVFWFPLFLIVAGGALLLNRLHVWWAPWPALLWLLVALGGAVKLYNGVAGKSRARVFWGFCWLACGAAFLLHVEGVLWFSPGTAVAALLLAPGVGLLLVFLVSPKDWVVVVPALSLLVLGGAILSTELGYVPESEVAPLVNRWWPLALILFGGALLVGSRRRPGLSGPPASSSPSPPRQ